MVKIKHKIIILIIIALSQFSVFNIYDRLQTVDSWQSDDSDLVEYTLDS